MWLDQLRKVWMNHSGSHGVWNLLYSSPTREEKRSVSGSFEQRSFMHDPMSFYSLFWFLIVGGLAGWIASVLVQGSGLGLIGDIAAGVAGAFLGAFIAV